jgi:hypothetical protein
VNQGTFLSLSKGPDRKKKKEREREREREREKLADKRQS